MLEKMASPIRWVLSLFNLALSFGSSWSASDDPEFNRQRRITLMIHYVMMSVGPLPNMLIYLFVGMRWPAMVLLWTCLVPSWISFGIYWMTRKIRISIYMISAMPLVAPICITLFAGGIRNSGFILHYVFVSPLVWACITGKLRSAMVLFFFASLAVTAHTVLENCISEWIVLSWGLNPSMPTETQRWFWWMNIVELQALNMIFFGYALVATLDHMKQQENLQRQMIFISQKLITLDLDEIPDPPAHATPVEQALFDVVTKIRLWKPYIPATVFYMPREESQVDENQVQCRIVPPLFEITDSSPGHEDRPFGSGIEECSSTWSDSVTAGNGASAHGDRNPLSSTGASHLRSFHSECVERAVVTDDFQSPTTSSTKQTPKLPPMLGLTDLTASPLTTARSSDSLVSHNLPVTSRLEPLNGSCSTSTSMFSPNSTNPNNNTICKSQHSSFNKSQGSNGDGAHGDVDPNSLKSLARTTSFLRPVSPVPRRNGHLLPLASVAQAAQSALAAALGKAGVQTLQSKRFTYVIIHRPDFCLAEGGIPGPDSLVSVSEQISTFFNCVCRHAQKQEGAVHQLHGDRVVVIWSGANQQVRACSAAWGVRTELEKCMKIHITVSSGPMLTGTIGQAQRMPLFAGPPQLIVEQLVPLCPVVSASFLVDARVATEINHEFDIAPVEVVSAPGFPSATNVIYEVFSKPTSKDASPNSGPDEWMYELASGSSVCFGLKEAYNLAFRHFAAGRMNEAKIGFKAVLDECNMHTNLGNSTSTTPTVSAYPPPGVSYHSETFYGRRVHALRLLHTIRLDDGDGERAFSTRRLTMPWGEPGWNGPSPTSIVNEKA